jgi:ATP-dependent DNA helicase 2 subunit 1
MEIVDDVVTSFDNLLSEMRFREAPKRAVWSIPFHLGEKFTIGVKGYVVSFSTELPQLYAMESDMALSLNSIGLIIRTAQT